MAHNFFETLECKPLPEKRDTFFGAMRQWQRCAADLNLAGTSRLKKALLLWACALVTTSAFAGPSLIVGMDADDHGFAAGGVNQNGWLFMQVSFQNLASLTANGQKKVVCLGCNSLQALSAFQSSFDLSTLPAAGWTRQSLTLPSDITAFFTGTGSHTVANTGILYMPTGDINVPGGISAAQLAAVNGQAAALNSFVGAGGGLFTQDQCFMAGGYVWLQTLLPTLTPHCGDIVNDSVLTLTAAGAAAYPGLTNSILTNASPWHTWFTNSGGGVGPLMIGPVTPSVNGGSPDGAVALGAAAGSIAAVAAPSVAVPTLPGRALWLLVALIAGTALLLVHRKANDC